MDVINSVSFMALQAQSERPYGLSVKAFDSRLPGDRPVIFVLHRYPWLIHCRQLYVRGHQENVTTTSCFDIVVLNESGRFYQVGDVIVRVPVWVRALPIPDNFYVTSC